MFAGDPDAATKAAAAAKSLAKHNDHMSHGRHISRDVAQGFGLKIMPLESDQQMQDLALSVYHAVTMAFSAGATVKLIENQNARAFVKQEFVPTMQPQQVRIGQPPIIIPQPPQPGTP